MASKRNFQAISVASTSTMKMKVCKARKITSKILKEAYKQQREVEDERKAETIPMSSFFNQTVHHLDDFNEEQSDEEFLSEQGLTIGKKVKEEESSEEEELVDSIFHKDGASIAKRLSDAITSIKNDATGSSSLAVSKSETTSIEDDPEDDPTGLAKALSRLAKAASTTKAPMTIPTVIKELQKLRKFMSLYTYGKVPTILHHVIRMKYWVSLVNFIHPENWTPNAMYKAANMFASCGRAKPFYELYLVPRVREDIRNHKKLHHWLYQSLKNSLFRAKVFYGTILIPLCKSGTCTLLEAVIIGSLMQKYSIAEISSSAALVCLAKMKFRGTTSYFIKVILEKKYALPYGAIDAVTAHFLRFRKEARAMPVIWHQTLLSFVQLYKHELRSEDKESLRDLLDKQNHELITPEIVRELDNSINPGEKLSSSPSVSLMNKPIKEDLFDMPQVPMEEDY